MSATGPVDTAHRAPSVFLSYASEDRPAAQSLKEALAAFGLDVWYDESGLDGGDAWDQKIRRQIRECDFFMPLVSAQTEARPEGYFRREWRLAVERTLDMADDHPFLLPAVLDDTTQAGARVPEKFLSVQWIRVPGGRPTPALEALCRRLVSGPRVVEPARTKPAAPAAPRSHARSRDYPQFPREETGQRIRFWVQVIGWALQSGWTFFTRLPRWVQIGVYIWLAIALLSRGCTHSEKHAGSTSSADSKTLTEIPAIQELSPNATNTTNLGSQIAQQVTAGIGEQLGMGRPLLAIPFSALSHDPSAQKLADSMFAQVYGTVDLSHHGHVALTKVPLAIPDLSAAVERGRAQHSKYVLFGAVDESARNLTVEIAAVADGSLLWSHSYSVADADPARIAADVDHSVPVLDE